MDGDNLRVGWKEIADFFKVHERTALRRRVRLKAAGVIWYKPNNKPGAAYNACAYESRLKEWCAHLTKKGEKF
ncbi:MAG: Lrp/AsnC family transcriptional regulator [Zetaproteobacteria bacterium]|nr:Lrp/AsnC family transcriptional regulator [Zetaproteobacteria bacterium]